MERTGVSDWDFGPLPESVERRHGGVQLQGYPALVDTGDRVDLRVLDSRPLAVSAHRAGVRRLLMQRLGKEMRYLRRNLPELQQLDADTHRGEYR